MDAERLAGVISQLVDTQERTTLVNDTSLVLRAGTTDGVGVAVVSGTGSNCVGRGPDGQEARIGGFGHGFGDDGSAEDIGREGARAAFRAEDGRGEPTELATLLVERFELSHLYELVDHFLMDAGGERTTMGALAPLVFEAAQRGDGVCQSILEDAGEALGHAAVVVAQRLFREGDELPLVLGGSVWQRGQGETMRSAFIERVQQVFQRARISTLAGPPVLGAALLAMDTLDATAARASSVRHRLADGLEVSA